MGLPAGVEVEGAAGHIHRAGAAVADFQAARMVDRAAAEIEDAGDARAIPKVEVAAQDSVTALGSLTVSVPGTGVADAGDGDKPHCR